ncbi:MAG TPA: SDR family oxidoreductase [Chitinophagaceae bacterium]|nr:SDR family oxidoreductase [Chitinophagaceae bacterium]
MAFSFSNKIALITGGASGIGKLMGHELLHRGAQLIIWDINQEQLANTVREFSSIGKVMGYVVDIRKIDQIRESAALVKKDHGPVDLLINNAGIIAGKLFHEHSVEDIARTMDVNAVAPMYITREFLPDMIERNSGHICNIASLAGLVSNYKMAAYVASKFSLTGFSDSLRIEMKLLNKNIGVTTVMPYYISTGMFSGVRSVLPILSPEKVAHKIIRAIERKRTHLGLPWPFHLIRFLQGILPVGVFDWFMGKLFRIYSSMDDFKGRD